MVTEQRPDWLDWLAGDTGFFQYHRCPRCPLTFVRPNTPLYYSYLLMERARCLPQINAIKILGNPAGKMFERQTKATVEVKTRHFVTTLEGEKQRYSRLTRYLCVFSHGTLSICRDNLFLSSYMPCSVHFVGNRLLTNDILRLAISILFVSCRGRKPIETS